MSDWNRTPGDSIALVDRAETFAESDVTTSATDAAAVGGAVGLAGSTPDETLSWGTGSSASNPGHGVVINPNNPLGGVEVTLSPNVSGVDEIRVFEAFDGPTRGSVTGSFTGGNVVTVPCRTLQPGVQYVVAPINNSGGDDYSVSTPVSGTDFDVEGVYEPGIGFVITGEVRNFADVTELTPATSGSATVEWPQPPDLFAWDTATFQTSPDGETVEVFVEQSTDGGGSWSEVAGPLSRGDEIPVSPDDEMRFRVDISRTNINNNPQVDALYRRYTV